MSEAGVQGTGAEPPVPPMPEADSFVDSSVGYSGAAPAVFSAQRADGGPGPARIQVAGELDHGTAPRLDDMLREAQLRSRLVVLDLHELTFMDCAGLRVILEAAESARRDDRKLAIVRGSPRIHRIFVLTGADRRLDWV